MMTAGLQRDVGHRASCSAAGAGECIYFGVRPAGALMPAAAHYFAAMDDDTSYARVRACTVQALFCKLQSLCHVGMISW